jgi:hypothetical protein
MRTGLNKNSRLMKTLMSGFAAIACLFALSAMMSTKARAQEVAFRTIATQPSATSEKKVFVRSKALLVRAAVVEEKLLQRPEFAQLEFVLTRDEASADYIVELRHDVLTKYVYSVIETRTQALIAGGKVSSLGGTVGGKVAKRFVKEMALRLRP